jgi:hypothetical protein
MWLNALVIGGSQPPITVDLSLVQQFFKQPASCILGNANQQRNFTDAMGLCGP